MNKLQKFWFILSTVSLFFTATTTVQAKDRKYHTNLPTINYNSVRIAQVPGGTMVYGRYITTTKLYRYYNGSDHFYTTDYSELGSGRGGYALEGWTDFLDGAFIANSQDDGTVPLYRYYNGSDHFYTTDYSELGAGRGGYILEKIQGYIYPDNPFRIPYQLDRRVVPLYRYYNGYDHFYTTNYNELESGRGGYVLEKIQGYVLRPLRGTCPSC